MSVHDVDADLCPVDAPLARQSWLPQGTRPWGESNGFAWEIPVGEQLAIVATLGGELGYQTYAVLVTDHPSQRYSGPAACGYCFPTTREPHSFHWGTSTSPICPGVPMPDFFSPCDAELIFEAGVDYTVGVSEHTRAPIKALYR